MKFFITRPEYKRKYLKEAINCCLAQTFTDFEFVIVNDAFPSEYSYNANYKQTKERLVYIDSHFRG